MLLRTRILIALSMLAVLLVSSCIFCILLLKDNSRRFDEMEGIEIEAVRVVEALRNTIETSVGDPADIKSIRGRIDALHLLLMHREDESRTVQLVEQMSAELEAAFKVSAIPDNSFAPTEAFSRLSELAATLAFELDRSSATLVSEQNIQAGRASQVLAALMICALIIIGFIYLDLLREVLVPIKELRQSIDQVRKEDYSGSIAVRASDEIGRVSEAFNEMAKELHERKIASDREVLQLNRESHDILLGFPYPLFVLNAEGNISQSNAASEPLLDASGKLPEKVSALVEHCVSEDIPYLPEDIDKSMLFRIDEREVWFLPRIFRFERLDSHVDIKDESNPGGDPGWVVLLIDVTRVRWLEGMRTDLLGTVSHEIKTPLTSIRLVLHLLHEQKTGALNDSQAKLVDSAFGECERLLETLDNLLQVNRSDSGSSDLEFESIAPSNLATVAEGNFRSMDGETGLRLHCIVDDDLPSVRADPQRIGMVMRNFISNAIKHSPSGGVVGVRCGPSRRGFVRFSVFDQGPGVSEEDSDKIFQRFYRGPAKARKIEGVGLGLSICREIVSAHSGRIGVLRIMADDKSLPQSLKDDFPQVRSARDDQSQENGSVTEFYFELPLANA